MASWPVPSYESVPYRLDHWVSGLVLVQSTSTSLQQTSSGGENARSCCLVEISMELMISSKKNRQTANGLWTLNLYWAWIPSIVKLGTFSVQQTTKLTLLWILSCQTILRIQCSKSMEVLKHHYDYTLLKLESKNNWFSNLAHLKRILLSMKLTNLSNWFIQKNVQ